MGKQISKFSGEGKSDQTITAPRLSVRVGVTGGRLGLQYTNLGKVTQLLGKKLIHLSN